MKAFFPAILWALVILVLSVLPDIRLPEPPTNLIGPDKLAHAAAYFVLAGLLLWGFSRRGTLHRRQIWLAVLLSAGFGLLVEILQWTFFPYRYFELYDILSNIIGSVVSVLLIHFFK